MSAPHRRSIWIPILLTLVAVGAVGSYFNRQANSGDKAKRETAALRTASVARGDVDLTVRISGVIAAERFAQIMAPRLRGSRVGGSGTGGQLASQEIVGNAPITVTAPYLPPSKGGTAGTASTSSAANSATANTPGASTSSAAASSASTPDASSSSGSGGSNASGSSSSSSGSGQFGFRAEI